MLNRNRFFCFYYFFRIFAGFKTFSSQTNYIYEKFKFEWGGLDLLPLEIRAKITELATNYKAAVKIAVGNISKNYAADFQAFKTQVVAKLQARQTLTDADIALAQKLQTASKAFQGDPLFEAVQAASAQVLAFCEKAAAQLQTKAVEVSQPEPEILADDQPTRSAQNAPQQIEISKKPKFGNHYFCPNSVFLGADDANTCEVRIIEVIVWNISMKTAAALKPVSKLISEVQFSPQLFAKIYNFYLSDTTHGLGKSLSKLHNNTISTSINRTSNGFNIPSTIKYFSSAKISVKCLQESQTEKPVMCVFLNTAGTIATGTDFTTYCDMLNILVHEYNHVEKDANNCLATEDPHLHLNSYRAEILHPSWANVTTKYRIFHTQVIGVYLTVILKRSTKDPRQVSVFNKLKKEFEGLLSIKFLNLEELSKIKTGNEEPENYKIKFEHVPPKK